MAQKLRVWDIS